MQNLKFLIRAWRKFYDKIVMNEAFKNRVLWWGPDR